MEVSSRNNASHPLHLRVLPVGVLGVGHAVESAERGKDHGVVRGGVALGVEDSVRELDGVVHHPVHLRDAAHRVGVLHLAATFVGLRDLARGAA